MGPYKWNGTAGLYLCAICQVSNSSISLLIQRRTVAEMRNVRTTAEQHRGMGDGRKMARVAVIGAGPAGLAVAHELLKESHNVTVFEASSSIGGAWQFDSSTDSDLVGLDPRRDKVHSSMYLGLRSNLPRHIMTFLDFPFLPAAMGDKSSDRRVYPLHSEILSYLEAFADKFQLRRYIRLNTQVLQVHPAAAAAGSCGATVHHNPGGSGSNSDGSCMLASDSSNKQQSGHCVGSTSSSAPEQHPPTVHQNDASEMGESEAGGITCKPSASVQWKVVTQSAAGSGQQRDGPQQQEAEPEEQLFDAVVSCVGIFSEPNLPQIAGMRAWPGLQLHSHNYRSAKMFSGMTVLVVGASFSGEEIARHIAREAHHVYQSARTFTGPGTTREPVQHTQDLNSSMHQQQQTSQQEDEQQFGEQSESLSIASTTQHDKLPTALDKQSTIHPQQVLLQTNSRIAAHEQQQHDIPEANEPRQNISRVPMLQQLLPDGSAVLQQGQVLQGIDAVVYCTGYKHSYPWLEHLDIVQTDDMHVRPLYLHMFPPSYAPSLCFIGLPWRCAKMPQFQLQGQLLAKLLSGRIQLPSVQEMQQDQQLLFAAMSAAGIPRRYTHCLASFMPEDEWQYADRLANMAAGASGTVACRCTCSQQQGAENSHRCRYLHPTRALQAACSTAEPMCTCQPTEDRQTQAGRQYAVDGSRQVVEQQEECNQLGDRRLLIMPEWFEKLGKSLAASILGRPDTFRDNWCSEVDSLLQDAEQHMRRLL